MNVAKFLQIICIWVQTAFYSIGGYLCLKSGGVTSIAGAFFVFVGIAHLVKLFNGSILKFESH
ncbi:MAG: hypothetical protein AB1498_11295 [bacterium]